MKRWLARILINRSLDDGTALPRWVANHLSHDANLRQFYEEQEDLLAQLQADAGTWASTSESEPAVPFAAAQPANRSLQKLVVVGTAIAAVITISMLLDRAPAPAPMTVENEPPPSFEVQQFQAAIERSGETAQKVTDHVNDVTTDFSVTKPEDIGRITRDYVQEAGSIFGRSLAMLDRANR